MSLSAGPDPTINGRRFVVTAGGTREPIDPVRFIGNRSSGKMGNELAAAAIRQGATLALVPTVDILRALHDDDAARDLFVVGFAAETEHVIANARAKLDAKHLDLVVVNDVSQEGIGMGADENEVTVIGRDGTLETIARAPKSVVADAIVRIIASRLR